jgi:hypothetical protein
MPDIERPCHLLPSVFQKPISHADSDPTNTEEHQDSNDSLPLAEVMKGIEKRTVQESTHSLHGDLLPGHPRGPRATTQKCKASVSPGGGDIGTST